MKRTDFVRKTPMARTGAPLKRSTFKRRAPKRRAGHDSTYLAACRGQRCYLAITGICSHDRATVVPAHSNQSKHGKGMGIKAQDVYTVPACFACHHEIDQGNRLTRDEKTQIWDAAYVRWSSDRQAIQEAR